MLRTRIDGGNVDSDVTRRVNHALPACRTCGDATFRMRTVNNVGESVLLHRATLLHTPDPFFFFRLFGEEDPRRRLPSLFLRRYFIRGCVCMIDVNVYDVLGSPAHETRLAELARSLSQLA